MTPARERARARLAPTRPEHHRRDGGQTATCYTLAVQPCRLARPPAGASKLSPARRDGRRSRRDCRERPGLDLSEKHGPGVQGVRSCTRRDSRLPPPRRRPLGSSRPRLAAWGGVTAPRSGRVDGGQTATCDTLAVQPCRLARPPAGASKRSPGRPRRVGRLRRPGRFCSPPLRSGRPEGRPLLCSSPSTHRNDASSRRATEGTLWNCVPSCEDAGTASGPPWASSAKGRPRSSRTGAPRGAGASNPREAPVVVPRPSSNSLGALNRTGAARCARPR